MFILCTALQVREQPAKEDIHIGSKALRLDVKAENDTINVDFSQQLLISYNPSKIKIKLKREILCAFKKKIQISFRFWHHTVGPG